MRRAHAGVRRAARRGRQSPRGHRPGAREAGREGPPQATRRRRRAGARRSRRFPVGLCALPGGDRGDHREARGEAGAVPGARGHRRRVLRPRLQHLVAVGHRDGRRMPPARARRGLPLLQPGAGDEDRRSGRRRADRTVGRRGAVRPRPALRPHAGALQRHAGLHRQPRRARLRARIAARAGRRRCRLRHHRSHPGRRRGLSPRALRPDGPGGPGRDPRRDALDVPAVLRGAEVQAVVPERAARRGRAARAQDRARLVRLRQGRRSREGSGTIRAGRRAGTGMVRARAEGVAAEARREIRRRPLGRVGLLLRAARPRRDRERARARARPESHSRASTPCSDSPSGAR